MKDLEGAGYAPYLTAVGGSGVGMLHPQERTKQSRVGGLAQGLVDEKEVEKLDGWAKGGGKWGFA